MFNSVAPLWLWLVFFSIVFVSLYVDFVLLAKQGAHAVTMREALRWCLGWVSLALLFNGLLYFALLQTHSAERAVQHSLEFLTGYLIEFSLSVDNIMIFLLIFSYFAVPQGLQKRVLMIGILGVIVLRTVMILIGAWLLQHFHWLLYVFGAFLILTGVKMWWMAGHTPDLKDNPVLKLTQRLIPISHSMRNDEFFTIENGRRIATPLFMVIVLIGFTDLIFAVDSIPAIFAITTDPFIVLSSNIFAVLGLRAMYFLLAIVANRFHLLNYGLAVVLVFIGAKMLFADFVKVPIWMSLGVVVAMLGASMLLSLKFPEKPKPAHPQHQS